MNAYQSQLTNQCINFMAVKYNHKKRYNICKKMISYQFFHERAFDENRIIYDFAVLFFCKMQPRSLDPIQHSSTDQIF